ncbi:hypothetical protein M5689_011201 [Euphorbia peplus]|nr:hypothetical protein M5689_011201 [Euphorbia peplus]
MNPDALQSMIKDSVDRFLTEYRNGTTDFSNFTSIFSRFLQKLPDPPLEIVWFYSALTFHSTKFYAENSSSSSSALMTKNLFQLLVSSSSSCNALKKIAVLSPVVYEFNSLVSEGDKWRKEADILLEVIFSYLSICRGSNFEQHGDEFGDFSCCFTDLVGVWTVERTRESCELGEALSMFFPFVSDGIRNGMVNEGCEVARLAGIVMAQVFLLRLCFKFRLGVSRVELEKELRDCAVQMMAAFRSFHFADVLLKILVEPLSSITSQSLLNSEDEVFLREVLYDITIMEYSFLGSQKWIHLPEGCLKSLAITWLFVAHNGVQFLMECGKKSKGVSYVQAFSECCLLSQLFKWVMNQPGRQSKTSKPEVSSPLSLIEWLLILEDEGLRVFDDDISKIYAKAIISKSRKGYFVAESDWKHSVYCGDYEGRGEEKVDSDLEMVDSEETTLIAGNLKTSATNGTKKRKEGMKDEMNRQVKVVKCHIDDNSVTENGYPLDDEALSSGSEVDNPSSDENVEAMEQ